MKYFNFIPVLLDESSVKSTAISPVFEQFLIQQRKFIWTPDFSDSKTDIQTGTTSIFRHLILFLVIFPRVWKLEIFRSDHHEVRTWNASFHGRLVCMQSLSKNEHYLLSIVFTLINISNTNRPSLKLCIIVKHIPFNTVTKGQVDLTTRKSKSLN